MADKKPTQRQRSNSGSSPSSAVQSWSVGLEDILSKKFGHLESKDPNLKKLNKEERKILDNLASVGIQAEDILEAKSRKRSSSVEEKKKISYFDPSSLGETPKSEYWSSLLTNE